MKLKSNFWKHILRNIWIFLFIYFFITLKYPAFGILALGCMLAPVFFAVFYGRKWCGWFCPRGNFNDRILAKISLKRKYPEFIKTNWFRILFLVVLMSAFSIQIFFADSLNMVGFVFLRMVLITTIIAIIFGIVYKERAWCMFCPMGSLATWVAAIPKFASKIKNVEFQKQECVSCNLCENACPMDIKITENDKFVNNPNCIKCEECVSKCKKSALKY